MLIKVVIVLCKENAENEYASVFFEGVPKEF